MNRENESKLHLTETQLFRDRFFRITRHDTNGFVGEKQPKPPQDVLAATTHFTANASFAFRPPLNAQWSVMYGGAISDEYRPGEDFSTITPRQRQGNKKKEVKQMVTPVLQLI